MSEPSPKGQTSLRILVADDVHDNADTCKMLLQMDGHDVRTAYSGREALTVATEFSPHIALLDIVMPEMTGYEVARQIRASPSGKEMLLVALTGYSQVEDKRKALAAGFDHHLAKPVGLESLQELIAKFRAASS